MKVLIGQYDCDDNICKTVQSILVKENKYKLFLFIQCSYYEYKLGTYIKCKC